jgi:8-oxo-dGTP pyrophosphatase MutT (NUDIX family)
VTDHSSYVLAPTWSGKPEQLQDQSDARCIISSELLVAGKIWDIRRDTIDLGDGQTVVRDLMLHPGAVAVIALDDQDRVFLLRQYRHPVAALLWEPVAGLLDVAGEAPLVGAQRELVEEAGLVAERWDVLLDFETSPGGSSEAIRVFLARDLSPTPGGRPHGDGEERDMPNTWVPLDLARDLVLAGHLSAPVVVSGVLAAWISRQSGWSTLRPADAPWPARDRLQHASRLRA